ncbi:hypothetical protein ACFZBU_01820 [Embleya sp. NPDC008237]|uniref:hypothetical protein n=1 Tax=Embleya sp. NPDC008237 TaxID=3363978 RepID=UPI0036F094B9
MKQPKKPAKCPYCKSTDIAEQVTIAIMRAKGLARAGHWLCRDCIQEWQPGRGSN